MAGFFMAAICAGSSGSFNLIMTIYIIIPDKICWKIYKTALT